MKIYIAGKMTGLPDLGREHFTEAAQRLRDAGHIVLNPTALPVGMPKNYYLPQCLSMIELADAVYLLDNWGDSKGATIEKLYAEYQGKELVFEKPIEAIKPYRSWEQLLEVPIADRTEEERIRMKRIVAIPFDVFSAVSKRVDDLSEQIMELEKERDKLIDFMNGEENEK